MSLPALAGESLCDQNIHNGRIRRMKLKTAFDKQREADIHMETKSAAPVATAGRMVFNFGIVITMLTGGALTMKLQQYNKVPQNKSIRFENVSFGYSKKMYCI